MSLPQFEEALRYVARFEKGGATADPLPAALKLITDNPARHGSRLLGRLLRALSEQRGEFRRAEISAFDAPALKVAIGLLDAAHAGANTPQQWLDVVVAADAANS
jgi:hypothetical protein